MQEGLGMNLGTKKTITTKKTKQQSSP